MLDAFTGVGEVICQKPPDEPELSGHLNTSQGRGAGFPPVAAQSQAVSTEKHRAWQAARSEGI